MKKLISVIMAVLMLVSAMSVACYAQDDAKSIPWVFVHGMNGYGENSSKYEKTPYWGKSNDLVAHLRSEGYEVYAPTIGPLSSSWDRACELYAQLTGTVVDYGEAHSEKYGHSRYGRDYTGKAIMGEAWDLDSQLNIIAHSLGSTTARIFISLLAYGDEDEIAASGEDISPLFEGGHDDCINAFVTLAGPHNGTPLADAILDMNIIPFAVCLVALVAPSTVNNFFMLEQFGIVSDSGFVSLTKALNFAKEDNSGTDITLEGAAAINEKFRLPDNILCVTSSASITKEGALGHQIGMAAGGTYTLTAELVSIAADLSYDGTVPGKDWEANDGLVPVISARYPLNDTLGHVDYTEGAAMERGVWNVLPTIQGTHSYYTGAFGASDDYFEFFDNLFALVCANT